MAAHGASKVMGGRVLIITIGAFLLLLFFGEHDHLAAIDGERE